MKKMMAAMVAGVGLSALLVGCATPVPMGMVYTEVKMPVAAGDVAPAASPKVGVAECTSFLGIVATGDASVATAKRNGGINKIHYIDWEVQNILGFIGKYKCVVYGE